MSSIFSMWCLDEKSYANVILSWLFFSKSLYLNILKFHNDVSMSTAFCLCSTWHLVSFFHLRNRVAFNCIKDFILFLWRKKLFPSCLFYFLEILLDVWSPVLTVVFMSPLKFCTSLFLIWEISLIFLAVFYWILLLRPLCF